MKEYGLTKFVNVENGDFFIHLGEEYLRCMPIHKQYDIYINAIRIRDGMPCIFYDEDWVELLEK